VKCMMPGMSAQTGPAVDVTVVVMTDCPHADLAATRLRQALTNLGRDATTFTTVVVASAKDADQAGLRGSPTFLVDGRDPFPGAADAGWACRLYPTDEGLQGSPSVAQLEQVLKR